MKCQPKATNELVKNVASDMPYSRWEKDLGMATPFFHRLFGRSLHNDKVSCLDLGFQVTILVSLDVEVWVRGQSQCR